MKMYIIVKYLSKKKTIIKYVNFIPKRAELNLSPCRMPSFPTSQCDSLGDMQSIVIAMSLLFPNK